MNTRTTARLVAGAAALGGLLCTAVPAHAAPLTAPVADAFMVSSSGLVTVAPTPHSNYPGPPSGLQTVASIAVAPFASNSTLTANTTGDPTAGTSFAEAKADSLSVALGGVTSLSLGAIDTTCNGTSTSNSGNSSIANASFVVAGVSTPITLQNVSQTIAIPGGLGSIQTFVSSTDHSTGVLTEDALVITLGNGKNAQTLTVGQASCGGAPPVSVNPTPMVSAPAAAGAGAAAIIGGVIMLRRRRKGASAGV